MKAFAESGPSFTPTIIMPSYTHLTESATDLRKPLSC